MPDTIPKPEGTYSLMENNVRSQYGLNKVACYKLMSASSHQIQIMIKLCHKWCMQHDNQVLLNDGTTVMIH